MAIVITGLIAGCSSASQHVSLPSPGKTLKAEAEELFRAGQWYQARKVTETILRQDPENTEAQRLMADILENEIVQHREILEPAAREEFSREETKAEIKTWLERAEALRQLGQYDEALLAAEKVFLYDPSHEEASRLIDEIREEAYRTGKNEKTFLNEMAHEEIRDRVSNYRLQARQWMDEGRWGAAKLALEKVLLLEPEDPEALALYKKIQANKEKGE